MSKAGCRVGRGEGAVEPILAKQGSGTGYKVLPDVWLITEVS